MKEFFGYEKASDPKWDKCEFDPLRVGRLQGAEEDPHDWNCKHWDDCEDIKLLTWKGTDEELSKKLKRTVAAIKARRRKLKKDDQ